MVINKQPVFEELGGMAEWLKAAVLKTVVPRGTVGSNPTPSAIIQVLHQDLAEDLMYG